MGVFGPRNPLFQKMGIWGPVWGWGNPKPRAKTKGITDRMADLVIGVPISVPISVPIFAPIFCSDFCRFLDPMDRDLRS